MIPKAFCHNYQLENYCGNNKSSQSTSWSKSKSTMDFINRSVHSYWNPLGSFCTATPSRKLAIISQWFKQCCDSHKGIITGFTAWKFWIQLCNKHKLQLVIKSHALHAFHKHVFRDGNHINYASFPSYKNNIFFPVLVKWKNWHVYR